jgi:two-component system, OmpR family, KDP operon response regulator KdpE
VTVGGRGVALTPTEYRLLHELAANAGRVLTQDQLLERVWGPEYLGGNAVLRGAIRDLRRRLGDDAHNPRYIMTVPRVGYRMPSPPS